MFGQEHRQATAKIVNCLFQEMATCSRSSNFFLALKMVTCEIPRQYEMSSVSRLMEVSIICRKWRSVTLVEAKFRLLRYLKTMRGRKRYRLLLPDRSRSSQKGLCELLNTSLFSTHYLWKFQSILGFIPKLLEKNGFRFSLPRASEHTIHACTHFFWHGTRVSAIDLTCIYHKLEWCSLHLFKTFYIIRKRCGPSHREDSVTSEAKRQKTLSVSFSITLKAY